MASSKDAEVIVSINRYNLCGIICYCGPHNEPLACGYVQGHIGPHSWATLPTFIDGKVVEN